MRQNGRLLKSNFSFLNHVCAISSCLPFDSCLVGTSILSILFTLSDISWFPVWMRDKVSYPYSTAGKTEGKGKKCEVALCLLLNNQ